jgi:hypothetical protein
MSALTFELTADTVGFDRAISAAEKKLLGFGNRISGDLKAIAASFAGYEAFKVLIADTITATGRIKDFSEQTGLTTDEVQRLDLAAKKVGGSFEDFQTAMLKMGAARKDAATSNQELLNFFNRWGISLSDLENPQLRTIDLFYKLTEAMQGATLSPRDSETAKDLFGGKKVEKVLAAMKELQALGPVKLISEKDIADLDRVSKQIDEMRRKIGVAMVPVMSSVANFVGNQFNRSNLAPSKEIANELFDYYYGKKDQTGAFFAGNYTLQTGFGDEKMQQTAYEQLMMYAGGDLFNGRGQLPDDMLKRFGITPRSREQGPALPHSAEGRREAAQVDANIAAENLRKIQYERTRNAQQKEFLELLKLESELTQKVMKMQFDMLSPRQQQEDIQRRINDGLALADELEAHGDEVGAGQVRSQVADLNQQLLGSLIKPVAPQADGAAQAGMFIGGAVGFNPGAFENREQIGLLRQVERNTAEIAKGIIKPTPPPPSIYQD